MYVHVCIHQTLHSIKIGTLPPKPALVHTYLPTQLSFPPHRGWAVQPLLMDTFLADDSRHLPQRLQRNLSYRHLPHQEWAKQNTYIRMYMGPFLVGTQVLRHHIIRELVFWPQFRDPSIFPHLDMIHMTTDPVSGTNSTFPGARHHTHAWPPLAHTTVHACMCMCMCVHVCVHMRLHYVNAQTWTTMKPSSTHYVHVHV